MIWIIGIGYCVYLAPGPWKLAAGFVLAVFVWAWLKNLTAAPRPDNMTPPPY
jgi:hypothetical protein